MKSYPTQTLKVNGDKQALVCVYLITPPEQTDDDAEPVDVAGIVLDAGKQALAAIDAAPSACSTSFVLDRSITSGVISIDVKEAEETPVNDASNEEA